VYEQLCQNYRAIDDFRMKLLGLLPFVTGAGVTVLLGLADGAKTKTTVDSHFLGGVGAFGFLVTWGLFAYEVHGIKKCGWLIITGRRIERRLGVQGPFTTRPQKVAGLIDEPIAASVIYPATLAAWVFLAFVTDHPVRALVLAGACFCGVSVGSLLGIRRIEQVMDRKARLGKLDSDPA
jgi:hypothetical protein